MADDKVLAEGKYLMYQGKPLVRENNTIIYGDLNNDACVMVLEIMKYKEENGEKLPDVIIVQIVDSKDPNKILKQEQRQGLHDAFSVGLKWLAAELKRSEA